MTNDEKRHWTGLLGIALLVGGCAQAGAKKESPLIARQALFGNPEKTSPQISPDGTTLAYLAPSGGVLNVWVAPIDDPAAARPVTNDTQRGIRFFHWAYTNRHLVYLQDSGGDENWRAYAVDLTADTTIDLTPLPDVAARIQHLSPQHPDEILVALNDRDRQYHDLYRVNIRTAKRVPTQLNTGFAGYVTDDGFRTRFAVRMLPDGGSEIFRADEGTLQPFATIGAEDALSTSIVDFDKTAEAIYLRDSRDRDTAVLREVQIATGESEVLAAHPRVDVESVLLHPTEKTVEAVGFNDLRQEWQYLDLRVAADFDLLRARGNADVRIVSRSLDDQHWIAALISDTGPVRYYHLDRPQRRVHYLFSNRAALEQLELARMHPVVIPARDGWELVSYLTLPVGTDPDGDAVPAHSLPMVLLVHGGPWARDSWGYNSFHQWLSNRGYAVLSVNYRGSTGFGKTFLNAGNKEWAGKMHDDLLDAASWAVAHKIADRTRMAIMGGSYGGYATLVGLTFTPDVFACGVDIVGPSNLITLLQSIPPYWTPLLNTFVTRIGDHRTEDGRKLLTERSPLTKADRICKPLLIAQGANDPRVKQAESDQIVAAVQARGIPVTYVLFPDEGHGFVRPENNMAFTAVTEAFLAAHLGGRYEPIGDDFAGSTITVPHGAEQVPGLAPALAP